VRAARSIGTPLAALALAGCMTLDTLNNRGYPGPYTYSGARGDLEIIGQAFLSFNLPLMLLFMLDLPFSALADTLVLPVTFPRERARLAQVEERRRVDIEQPALVTALPGEEPEVTAERLVERCREASKNQSDELLDCYSIGARIRVRSESHPDAEPRRLAGGAYKLELREVLAEQRYLGDVVDWSDAEFEREAGGVRVTATRSRARSAETHRQSWLVGPCADGGWRILEEDGFGWSAPAGKP
jgi:uncharacterized protein YceK